MYSEKDNAQSDAADADHHVGDAQERVLGAHPRRRTDYEPLLPVETCHRIVCSR